MKTVSLAIGLLSPLGVTFATILPPGAHALNISAIRLTTQGDNNDVNGDDTLRFRGLESSVSPPVRAETGAAARLGGHWVMADSDVGIGTQPGLTGPPRAIGQVTSVDQLTDVQPTDWALPALRSLLERYGCIAGHPDGTFRGNQLATRFELAAALSACLEQLQGNAASQTELEALKALQGDIAQMLATLSGVVDALEQRTATVETQQFSTTTKLQGEVVLAAQFGDFTDSFVFSNNNGSNDVLPTPEVGPGLFGTPATPLVASGEVRGSAIARVRLSFNTSFRGTDQLNTVLETGNGGSDLFTSLGLAGSTNPFPVPPVVGTSATTGTQPALVDLGAVDYAGVGPDVSLYRLAYSFEPFKNVTLTAGSNIYPSDFIDFNSYANDETQDFSSGFFLNNPLIVTNNIDARGGAGIAVNWAANDQLTLRGLFIAANANLPNGPDAGLISAPFQGSAELEYATEFGATSNNNLAVRLQYTRTANGFAIQNNVLGINAEATFGQVGIFGRYGISLSPELDIGGNPGLFTFVPGVDADANIQTWMAGVGVRDLAFEGSLLAFAVGQPFVVNTDLARYTPQTNFELFYRMPVSDNITITPAIMLITHPFNIEPTASEPDNTIVQGVLRTTFSF